MIGALITFAVLALLFVLPFLFLAAARYEARRAAVQLRAGRLARGEADEPTMRAQLQQDHTDHWTTPEGMDMAEMQARLEAQQREIDELRQRLADREGGATSEAEGTTGG